MATNMDMSKLLMGTDDRMLSVCLFLLRCTAGIILFVAGASKVMGWFGGMGMETTVQNFAKSGISPFLAYVSSYTEFIGGALLMIGFLTRPVAFAVMINMLVATIKLMPKGFFFGGAAYPFTLLIISIVVLLAGPMTYSIDAAMTSLRTAEKKRTEDESTAAA